MLIPTDEFEEVVIVPRKVRIWKSGRHWGVWIPVGLFNFQLVHSSGSWTHALEVANEYSWRQHATYQG